MACIGLRKRANRMLVGKPEGKRQLGKLRQCWKNNIKVDLKEIGWGCKLD
jgi:hypothetical protein